MSKEKTTQNTSKLSWLATNMNDIMKLPIAITFLGTMVYTSIDWLSTKFVTRLEASNYALKQNLSEVNDQLARTQIFVLQNELYNARKQGIKDADKAYLRTLDKRIFDLKIRLNLFQAKPSDYIIPKYLKE